MDLSHYIKKSDTAKRTVRSYPVEKKCLECGKKLEKETTDRHLFLHSFCSFECKERYVGSGNYP